jgi:hypothetical protein
MLGQQRQKYVLPRRLTPLARKEPCLHNSGDLFRKDPDQLRLGGGPPVHPVRQRDSGTTLIGWM